MREFEEKYRFDYQNICYECDFPDVKWLLFTESKIDIGNNVEYRMTEEQKKVILESCVETKVINS